MRHTTFWEKLGVFGQLVLQVSAWGLVTYQAIMMAAYLWVQHAT